MLITRTTNNHGLLLMSWKSYIVSASSACNGVRRERRPTTAGLLRELSGSPGSRGPGHLDMPACLCLARCCRRPAGTPQQGASSLRGAHEQIPSAPLVLHVGPRGAREATSQLRRLIDACALLLGRRRPAGQRLDAHACWRWHSHAEDGAKYISTLTYYARSPTW